MNLTLHLLFSFFLIIHLVSIVFYIPRISLWFSGLKKQDRLFNPNINKMAIIVPARREGKTLINLFNSIKEQNYVKDNFDVYLIVDDENDKGLFYAKEIMPNLIPLVLKNQRRKADSIDYAFKYILKNSPDKYDDFIVVDADNVLTPDFLLEMNNATVSGADFIVPRKRIKNWESSDKKLRTVITSCSASTYVGVDAMGNKGKCKKGYLLNLCGQGMLIKSKVIKKWQGYPFHGITEDYEIAVECMRNGYKDFYYEYAEIFSEEPVTRKEYNKRRIRWIKGFAQFNERYGKEIKDMIKGDKVLKKRTAFFRLAPYPVYYMFGACGIFAVVFFILGIVSRLNGANNLYPFILSLICLSLIYLELFIYGLFILNADKDVNKMTCAEKIKFLFSFPVITSEYVKVFFIAFTTKKDFAVWEPIERLNF